MEGLQEACLLFGIHLRGIHFGTSPQCARWCTGYGCQGIVQTGQSLIDVMQRGATTGKAERGEQWNKNTGWPLAVRDISGSSCVLRDY